MYQLKLISDIGTDYTQLHSLFSPTDTHFNCVWISVVGLIFHEGKSTYHA
jgi:hypothetical protein